MAFWIHALVALRDWLFRTKWTITYFYLHLYQDIQIISRQHSYFYIRFSLPSSWIWHFRLSRLAFSTVLWVLPWDYLYILIYFTQSYHWHYKHFLFRGCQLIVYIPFHIPDITMQCGIGVCIHHSLLIALPARTLCRKPLEIDLSTPILTECAIKLVGTTRYHLHVSTLIWCEMGPRPRTEHLTWNWMVGGCKNLFEIWKDSTFN